MDSDTPELRINKYIKTNKYIKKGNKEEKKLDSDTPELDVNKQKMKKTSMQNSYNFIYELRYKVIWVVIDLFEFWKIDLFSRIQ